jgi:hypothetical protein
MMAIQNFSFWYDASSWWTIGAKDLKIYVEV